MNKLIFSLILITAAQICFAQKKTTNSKATNKISDTEIKTTEALNIPFALISTSPSKQLSPEAISKIKSKGLYITENYKIPTSYLEDDYMFDNFILYGDKKDSYLIDVNGNVEAIPLNTRLITTTKTGSKILVDNCEDRSEWAKCTNIRIADNTGKLINTDLSKYYIALGSTFDLYNSENNTYVIVSSSPGSENIITENGKPFFTTDVSGIRFIIPGYISYEEVGMKKLMELKTKKNIDISKYTQIYGLSKNKLIVGIQNNEYALFNPVTSNVIFKSEKLIAEVKRIDKVTAKNYFTLSSGNNDFTLVDVNGKKVLAEVYKRIVFQDDGFTIFVENNEDKKNEYNLKKNEFSYKKFYKDISKTKELTFIMYDKYYEVYDNVTNTLLYDETKRVSHFNDNMGTMFLINKRVNDNSFSTIYDVYSKQNKTLIYENIAGLSRIENTDYYFKLNKNNLGNKYSIVDKNGKIIIQEIFIPNYIQFNNNKGVFELTKKKNGKVDECYDKIGNKINCQ